MGFIKNGRSQDTKKKKKRVDESWKKGNLFEKSAVLVQAFTRKFPKGGNIVYKQQTTGAYWSGY